MGTEKWVSIFNSVESETWMLPTKMIQKLQIAQKNMEGILLGIMRMERKKIKQIKDKTKVMDVTCHINLQKWG